VISLNLWNVIQTWAVLGVLFVNGWTDAPNAIASAIGSGAFSMKKGVWLATLMNLLGGIAALSMGQQVAKTMGALGNFPADTRGTAAVSACLLAVVVWAVAAWFFGIPTSESHGLMAALMGGALRLHPRIGVADGKMSAGKKYRGRMDRVIRDYVADMKDELLAAKKDHVFITHAGCDENTLAAAYGMLDDLHHFDEMKSLMERGAGVQGLENNQTYNLGGNWPTYRKK
jgi:RNase P protein component